MMPTLNPRGDVLLTEYLSPRLSLLKAGDVVVATKPNDGTVSVIKRIRGMEGDRIWVRPRGSPHAEEVVVPRGHVWLEGDNPHQSTDSREYGPVPLGLVRGRIVARFWPPAAACFMASRVIDHTLGERAATFALFQSNARHESADASLAAAAAAASSNQASGATLAEQNTLPLSMSSPPTPPQLLPPAPTLPTNAK
jgi:mitochondrial inner membrane protease subunit 1